MVFSVPVLNDGPVSTWDVQMMSETKFYSYARNEQNKWYGII